MISQLHAHQLTESSGLSRCYLHMDQGLSRSEGQEGPKVAAAVVLW